MVSTAYSVLIAQGLKAKDIEDFVQFYEADFTGSLCYVGAWAGRLRVGSYDAIDNANIFVATDDLDLEDIRNFDMEDFIPWN